jgi:hypothetical protein
MNPRIASVFYGNFQTLAENLGSVSVKIMEENPGIIEPLKRCAYNREAGEVELYLTDKMISGKDPLCEHLKLSKKDGYFLHTAIKIALHEAPGSSIPPELKGEVFSTDMWGEV